MAFKLVSLLILEGIGEMKALLGMAKERRKDEQKEVKPLAKLNLQKRQPEPSEPSEHSQQMQAEFEQEYQPEIEQILGYAEYIGIKLPQQQDLLYIAKEGLMANLPPEWDEQQTQDGNILYINRRSGEVIAEHPCDQYYRQLVVKERKKKGNAGAKGKFGGIQPVGVLGGQSKAMPMQQIQPPRKDIDPLVKMQQQKKKKKLEQQKRKQFEQKKKQISDKIDKKKQTLENDHKTKQKKLRQKYDEILQSQRARVIKKMSEEDRAQEEKAKKEMERFQRETRAKLEKKFYDKRASEKERIEKVMKARREEIRVGLEGQFKVQRKELEEEYKEKMRILAQKQRSSLQQKSQSQLLHQQLQTLKHQILQTRLQQHTSLLQSQKQTQQSLYKQKLLTLQKCHEEAIKSLETSAPKNQIKFDTLAQEVEQAQREEMEVLEYELGMLRDVKRAEKECLLERERGRILGENAEELARMERETENMIAKLRKAKQEQYNNKIAQAEKHLNQSYLQSLKTLHTKFTQQQQLIHLETQPQQSSQPPASSLQLLDQVQARLARREETLRAEIEAIEGEIRGLGKGRFLRHRLGDQEGRVYEIVRERIAAG